jgi:hypothetical protein
VRSHSCALERLMKVASFSDLTGIRPEEALFDRKASRLSVRSEPSRSVCASLPTDSEVYMHRTSSFTQQGTPLMLVLLVRV